MPWSGGSARFQSASLILVPDARATVAESGSGFSTRLCPGAFWPALSFQHVVTFSACPRPYLSAAL